MRWLKEKDSNSKYFHEMVALKDGLLAMINKFVVETRKKIRELILFKADFEKACDLMEKDSLDMVLKLLYFPLK